MKPKVLLFLIVQLFTIAVMAEMSAYADAIVVPYNGSWLIVIPRTPEKPTNLVVSPKGVQVDLSWTGSTSALTYNVYRGTTSGGEGSTPYRTGLTSTSFTDAAVSNGATYFYQVTSVGNYGESAKSNEASATIVPSAPSNLRAAAGTNSIVLSWTGSSGATSYNLYRGTSSGGETKYKSSIVGTSYTDTGVSGGVVYYYRAAAVNSSGENGKSNEVSAKLLADLVPYFYSFCTFIGGSSTCTWDIIPAAGEPFYLCWQVENEGTWTATSHTDYLALAQNGVTKYFYYYPVSQSTSVDGVYAFCWGFAGGLPASGTYDYVGGYGVDCYGSIAESSESNNWAYIDFPVVAL
jgi:fibronectin type 3 domain-containing protein